MALTCKRPPLPEIIENAKSGLNLMIKDLLAEEAEMRLSTTQILQNKAEYGFEW